MARAAFNLPRALLAFKSNKRCSSIRMAKGPTPVRFRCLVHARRKPWTDAERAKVIMCSHGSTMMLGEDSAPGRFWESVGKEARRRNIKGTSVVSWGKARGTS